MFRHFHVIIRQYYICASLKLHKFSKLQLLVHKIKLFHINSRKFLHYGCWSYSSIKSVKWQNIFNILRTFGKLRKATNSFAMSLCPSVRMEQPGCHWTDFHDIWYLSIFRKTVVKIKVSLKSDKNLAPIGRIFIKFEIGVFFENQSRKFKFH